MSARSDLAAAIKSAVPDGTQVYGYMTDVVALPCVVLERTLTEPLTVSGPQFLEHRIVCHILATRANPSYSEDQIEELFMDIVTNIPRGVRWESLSGVEATTANGVEAVSAQLTIVWKE